MVLLMVSVSVAGVKLLSIAVCVIFAINKQNLISAVNSNIVSSWLQIIPQFNPLVQRNKLCSSVQTVHSNHDMHYERTISISSTYN